MEANDEPRHAGGYATQRGINYQNRVAAYFAACCLAERESLPELTHLPVKAIRCETGEPLADILLSFEDDGLGFVEVKRSIQLIPARMKGLVSNLIRQFLASEQGTSGGKFPWRRPLDATRDRLLLVTSSDSPESVTKDLAACLARITPESKPDDLHSIPRNERETRAFNEFHALTLETWKDLLGTIPTLERVLRLYSLLRISSLDTEPGASGEQQAKDLLRHSVLAGASDSSQAWAMLVNLMGFASETRISVTREELRRELQRNGFFLRSTPSYLADIGALREYTRLTLRSLDHLSTLLVRGRQVRIERPVTAYLRREVDKQSLVVIGEPGAGKSGVLHELATALTNEERDVVFLAADRIDHSITDELGLKYELADVLENWSGDKPGLLLIDALDAARGSNALLVLRDLIRRVVNTNGSRWRVVASVRVFDLRYSHDLQQIFHRPYGVECPTEYQDQYFSNIRHIKVPRFSATELQGIRSMAPELGPTFDAATPALRDLLDIPFNLRLVTEMISDTSQDTDLSGIETQVGLLSRYWLSRVIKSPAEGIARELVLADVLRVLVDDRRLTVSKLRIPDAARATEFTSLCSDNVLVEQVANLHGRNIVGFSHHLLFDYAASRLIVSPEFILFLQRVARERDLALFLRPSIDLLFKEAWLTSRDEFWMYLNLLSAHAGVPAIAKIIGPAVIPELAKVDEDLAPLVAALSSEEREVVDRAEQWIIHVIGAVLAGVPVSGLILWSRFCEALASCPSSIRVAAVCQSLIDDLLDRMKRGETNSLTGRQALCRAAVRLLDRFLTVEKREAWIVGRTISNLMDLFPFNPAESAQTVRKLITPEEIRNRGAEQGHWIARKAHQIFDLDPELTAEIYVAFFGYQESSEAQTSMSGSQILALNSTRKQDYRHTQWQLAEHFPKFIEGHFDLCTQIVLAAMNEYIEREHKPRTPTDVIAYKLPDGDHTVHVDYSAIWDTSTVRSDVQNITDTYFHRLEELARTSETTATALDAASLLLQSAKYAYFPRRVLAVAAKTGGNLAPAVYPLLVSASALTSYDLSSAIGEALRTNFSRLDGSQREAIEAAIHRIPEGATGDVLEAKEHIRDTLLGCLPFDQLALPRSIALARELSARGGAPANRPPFRSFGVQASSYSETDHLRERGVPVDAEPNARLRKKSSRLWEFASKFTNAVPQDSDVADIEAEIDAVRHVLLEENEGIHEEIKNSSEAHLLAACATVAKVKSLSCATSLGRKIRDILYSGLDCEEPQYHPEYDAQFDRSPSWSAPLQRIEAAAGIASLLEHSDCLDDGLLQNVRRVLADPVPAVRFQVATRLLALYDKDIETLWTLLRKLITEEPRTGVLSGVLYAVINPQSGRHRTETIELIRTILRRTDLGDGGDAVEWCYQIAAGLYIWQDDRSAWALVREVTEAASFDPHRAAHCLRNIREPLTFTSDVPRETDAGVRKRAFSLVETIISSASLGIDRLLHRTEVADRNENWQKKFQELAQLIDFVGNQIYFSSGAYDGTDSSGKLDEHARRAFWNESRSAIRLLSAVAIPSVAHHLIETLESFIPFEPADVFHAIAVVVSAAKDWGYQYESMAVDLLVKVTEIYLAEHRLLLQQDVRCREELIDILETFVNAGWPSARRLSYRLEEIFR